MSEGPSAIHELHPSVGSRATGAPLGYAAARATSAASAAVFIGALRGCCDWDIHVNTDAHGHYRHGAAEQAGKNIIRSCEALADIALRRAKELDRL